MEQDIKEIALQKIVTLSRYLKRSKENNGAYVLNNGIISQLNSVVSIAEKIEKAYPKKY